MTIDPQLRDLNIDLPACPETLVKLSLLMADENCAIDALATLIEGDMALASAVVRTVNSALFGLLKRVETVHEAVRYLGMAQVAGLTYEIGLRGAFTPSPSLQSIWDRASVRGLAMGRIARQLDVDPWQAHTVGLFAESGRAVLYAHDRERYVALERKALDEAQLCASEIETFGVSHTALGAALCQSWGLSREVTDSVRARTRPFSSPPCGCASASMCRNDTADLPRAKAQTVLQTVTRPPIRLIDLPDGWAHSGFSKT